MRSVALIVLLLWAGGYCAGKTIYVDVNGPNDPGTGSSEDPFRRIQDAIDEDAITTGDSIEIQPGVYTGQGNYDLDPGGLAITIRSTDPNDPDVVAATIINPNNAGRGFYFNSGEDANCVIAGLSITDANTNGSGGGIYCLQSSPAIKNCVIIKNTAAVGGGGIYCLSSALTLVNCIIAANRTGTGGAGGGIRCLLSNPVIINCTISGNSAEYSGEGVYCADSNLAITNSVIWANGSSPIHATGQEPTITYSDVQGGWSGTGNIDNDPCFVAFGPNDNPELWDFHLRSAFGRWDSNSQSWVTDANTSLCIDAGDPDSDSSGEPWPNGKRINMGFYGGTAQASKYGNPADFDISGDVNLLDFIQLASKWLHQEACIVDLNLDSYIDFYDLGLFTENWLWQKQ